MAAKAHAILSASSSDRWLHCLPSARLLIPSSCMADELTDSPTVSFPRHSAMLMITPTSEYLIIALFLSFGSMWDMIHHRIAF